MLLGAALLIVAGLKMFVHLHEYKDVLCWDEAAYMRGGVSITQKIPKGWGPLYSFWYFLLLIGQKVFASIDLLKLNYLNFKISRNYRSGFVVPFYVVETRASNRCICYQCRLFNECSEHFNLAAYLAFHFYGAAYWFNYQSLF
jgi:hypothetical protein